MKDQNDIARRHLTVADATSKQRLNFMTETQLPTAEALFRLLHFQEIETGLPYLALLLGDLLDCQQQPPLLRLHSACTTGDIFGSQRCDCQAQMHEALHIIASEGRGLFVYLPQEGRGIGLTGKLQAYVLQEQGYDTVEANERLGYPIDARNYAGAIEIQRYYHTTRAARNCTYYQQLALSTNQTATYGTSVDISHETPRISILGVKMKRVFPEERGEPSFVCVRDEN
jgi:3,4-dihydroxy 2-butanone 4-phosphate synthase/GTP cyclohydrolase II